MEPVPSQSLANFEQKQEQPMSNRAIIPTSDLNGNQSQRMIIRRDLKNRNRIYCNFPPYSSLTHDEAIVIANRLADLLEQDQ